MLVTVRKHDTIGGMATAANRTAKLSTLQLPLEQSCFTAIATPSQNPRSTFPPTPCTHSDTHTDLQLVLGGRFAVGQEA